MSQSSSKNETSTAATAAAAKASTTAAQQGDNIAHALAGAGGGLLSMALTYPLITLSTRAQVESKRAHSSTYDAVRRIVQREGIAGLYSGLDSALFGISVTNFVYYYWYEWTRAFFQRAALRRQRVSANLTTVESIIAGAIAGSATVLITNPIWVINTRMTARSSPPSSTSSSPDSSGTLPAPATASGVSESQPKSKPSPPSTLSTLLALLREEGPSALFAGVLPALVLVINPILQYTIFEQLRLLLAARRSASRSSGSRLIGARDVFVLGALGKLLATALTYPYITVKSRMHVRRKDSESGGEGEGTTAALRRVVREEGWSGLYKGLGPKVTQSVLTAAFLFAFKDALYDASVKLRKRAPKAVGVS